MSQPSDVPVGADAPTRTRDEEISEPITFTLVVVSPSVGVVSPLTFPQLDATTTVKQLKAKLRDALPSKPTDENQRLIHRGRLLARETQTMLDIFGKEALGNPESQTLHLVLRPPVVESPATLALAGNPQRAMPSFPTQLQARPQSTPANPIQAMHVQPPLSGFQHIRQQQPLQADYLQSTMSQRLQQLQRDTARLHQEMVNEQRSRNLTAATANPELLDGQPSGMRPLAVPQGPSVFRSPPAMTVAFQNLIAQQQRERATAGRHGIQDTGGIPIPLGQQRQPSSGRASPNVHRPDHTTTYTREGIGPNGERWQMTVNETTTTFPIGQNQPHHNHHHHPGLHMNNLPMNNSAVLDLLQNADRNLPIQNMPNNIERTASGPAAIDLGSAGPARISTPVVAASDTPGNIATPASTNGSPTGSMDVNVGGYTAFHANNPALNAPPSGHIDPMVYILSSPSGPRALLLNNLETFYTPRQQSRRRRLADVAPSGLAHPTAQGQQAQAAAAGFHEIRNGAVQRPAQRGHRRAENNPLAPVNVAPHANPGAGALAAQIGPMIWLIIRLIGFVWFFTAGNSSWTRWLMVSGLALVVFMVNTGIFNGIFEQLWGPIRRHVEALIPLAGPEAALVPAVNAAIPPQPGAAAPLVGNQEHQGQRRGEPDPAQVAAHLLEQHRQRHAGWLMTQIRQVEHAMLLFLASLVPGVGERHIAAREAEANAAEAERQRQTEAAAATTEIERQRLHANEEATRNPEGGSGEQTTASGDGAVGDENTENRRNQREDGDGVDVPAPAQPVVEV